MRNMTMVRKQPAQLQAANRYQGAAPLRKHHLAMASITSAWHALRHRDRGPTRPGQKTNKNKGRGFMRSFAKLHAAVLALLASSAGLSAAEMRGVTSGEIKIGQTMPYSGPVSAFGALGKGEVGYFRMVNERGGINGRKVNLISLDDSYAPPKTVEQTRPLVESDEVAMIFSSIGTAHNPAIRKCQH